MRLGALGLPASLARFLVGRPLREEAWVALHALVAGRAPDDVPLSATDSEIARCAHRGEVVNLACASAPRLEAELGAIALRQRRFDALLELALADMAPAMVALGAPVALLKGSAAAAWVYDESAWRMRRDVDVLVGDALPEVRQALSARGWRDHADPNASQDVASARAWPMAREIGNTTVSVDLHRGLIHGDWCRPDVAAMLESAVAGRAILPVTSVADTFVHTALHLTGTGFHEPLKGWVDLLRLLPLVGADELAARARLHGLATATWAVLGVVGRWFAVDVTAHRAALGEPAQGRLIDHLLAGAHATPERQPIPRGAAYRIWRVLARDIDV